MRAAIASLMLTINMIIFIQASPVPDIPRPKPKPVPRAVSDGVWTSAEKISDRRYAADGSRGDRFGYSVVALGSGDLLVGAPLKEGKGVTYVTSSGSSFFTMERADDRSTQFGASISVDPSGTSAFVTGKYMIGPKKENAVFVYETAENGLGWDLHQAVTVPTAFDTPLAVASSDRAFIIGCPWKNSPAEGGSAYLYQKENHTYM